MKARYFIAASVLAIYFQASPHLPVQAQLEENFSAPASTGESDDDKLSSLERRLFFKTYADENASSRLTRIENDVFGQPGKGDFHARLIRVSDAFGKQQNSSGFFSNPNNSYNSSGGEISPATTDSAPPINQLNLRQPTAPPEAEDTQGAAIQAREQQIAQLLAQGVELWRHKQKQDAIDKFSQVLSLDPNNAEAHYSMGIVYESDSNFAQAMDSYKAALREQPNNKDYKEAVRSTEKKMKSGGNIANNQEGQALAQNAAAAYKRGEFISALDLYKQLEAKVPNQAMVKYNIGTIYLQLDRPTDAYEYYRQAAKLNPNEPRYTEAAAKLKTTIKADEQSRKQAESAWQQPGSQNKTTAKQPKVSKNEQALAIFGIVAKNSHDGVAITSIGVGSRAGAGGLKPGDIIKAVGGSIVKSPADVNNAILHLPPNGPIQMLIQRGSQMGALNL